MNEWQAALVPPMHRDYRDRPDTWIKPVIHSEARLEKYTTVQYGTVRATRIGASWLMPGAYVCHDAVIGDGCEIADKATIGAHCDIGDNVRIGLHTVIRPRIKVGAGARTGCGAVVVRDIPPGETWVGSPARKLEKGEPFDRLAEEARMWGEWWDKSRA